MYTGYWGIMLGGERYASNRRFVVENVNHVGSISNFILIGMFQIG